jgi:hypothetical protein
MRKRVGPAPAFGRHRYGVYGVHVTSDWPFDFPLPRRQPTPLADVAVIRGSDDDFALVADSETETAGEGYVYRDLPDGSSYFRWFGKFEFKADADGSRIACRSLNGCGANVLQNFLFGRALSFALTRQGIECWHAAVVRIGDAAVGFLGDCCYGKSTLLAAFVQAGCRVLTDDLLVVDSRDGRPVALPGSGRIKLRPDSAEAFWDDISEGTPLFPATTKRSYRIGANRFQSTGLPLRHLYVLPTPEEREGAGSIEIQSQSPRALVHELLKNSFNAEVLDRQRLSRQFVCATELAGCVSGFKLRYRPGMNHLPEVCDRIFKHVSSSSRRITDASARQADVFRTGEAEAVQHAPTDQLWPHQGHRSG